MNRHVRADWMDEPTERSGRTLLLDERSDGHTYAMRHSHTSKLYNTLLRLLDVYFWLKAALHHHHNQLTEYTLGFSLKTQRSNIQKTQQFSRSRPLFSRFFLVSFSSAVREYCCRLLHSHSHHYHQSVISFGRIIWKSK